MKMLMLIFALFLVACTAPQQSNLQLIKLQTSDGVNLAGDFYPASSDKGIILLHMLNRARSDWTDFATYLQDSGYNVVAIDFRGHGDSEGSWSEFTADDFKKMVYDVAAAKAFLDGKKISKVGIVGASMGANIALNYVVGDPSIKTIVLLSPGLDYRGVKTEDAMLAYSRSVLIVTSKDDSDSFSSSNALYKEASGKKLLQVYDSAGHGTRMFDSEKDLKDIIKIWLDDQVK